MIEVDKQTIAKAKRRIQRFIKTEKPVARVRATDDPMIFKYVAKHYGLTIWFRRDILGRLKRIDPSKVKMVA